MEQIIAVLSRMYPNSATEAEHQEMRAGVGALANNYKRVMLEMRPSANQVRRFLRSHGIRKDPNKATSQYQLLSADGPETRAAFGAFARKLFTALHYKHTGKIIPAAGGVGWWFFSNVDSVTDGIPQGILSLVQRVPVLKRGKKPLDSQFSYRFQCSDTGEVAVYLATFRFSFAIMGHVQFDATGFPAEIADKVVRPMQWR